MKRIGAFFRKFFIWIITTILSFCLVTFIFITAVHIDLNQIIEDIYSYSNNDAQQKIHSLITNACITAPYSDDTPEQLMQICSDFEQQKVAESATFKRIVFFLLGEINQADFQKNMENKITSEIAIGDQNQFTEMFTTYKNIRQMIIPFATFLIIFLFILLYLFYLKNPIEYMKKSGTIFLKLALIFIIPFCLLQLYLFVHPLDTTPIINNFLTNLDTSDNGSITPESQMESIILLTLKTIYTIKLFVISLIILAIAILLRYVLPKYLNRENHHANLIKNTN